MRVFVSALSCLLVLGLFGSVLATEESLVQIKQLIAEGKYAEAESEAGLLLAKVEADKGPESSEAAEVINLLVQAMWRGGKAREPETIKLARRAVSIDGKIDSEKNIGLAHSLVELGNVLEDREEHSEARLQFERAMAIYEEVFGADSENVAVVLHNLGSLSWRLNEFKEARSYLSKALAIEEKLFGSEDPRVASSLGTLANVTSMSGDVKGSIPVHERALAIQEKAQGQDHPHVANTLSNLGLSYIELGEYEKAEELLLRALAIRELKLGPSHPMVGHTTGNLAILYSRIGRVEARSYWDRTIRVFEKAEGSEGLGVAIALANMAMDESDYLVARELSERALEIFENADEPDQLRVAWVLNSMATKSIGIGDYAAAQAKLERSLEIFERLVGIDHRLVPSVFTSLGAVHWKTGRTSEAKTYYERALAIQERITSTDHPNVATLLVELASFLYETGRFEEAKPLFTRSMEIRENKFGKGHNSLASSLLGIARVSEAEGDLNEAIELYRHALAIQEENLVHNHPEISTTLLSLAQALARTGDHDAAMEAALRSEEISRDNLYLTARGLAEREALRYALTRTSGLNMMLSLLTPESDNLSVRSAFDSVIRSRALVLDEMASRHRVVTQSKDPETVRQTSELTAVRSQLANLMLRDVEARPEGYRQLLDHVGQEKERLERELAMRSLSFRQDQMKSRAGLSEVISNLPSETALVAFVRYGDSIKNQEIAGGKPSYLAFVLPPGAKDPLLVSIGSVEKVDALVSRWGAQIREAVRSSGRDPAQVETDYRRAGEALRREVWEPVASHFGDAGQVFIVPDGSLHQVNFSALPSTVDRYLIEDGPVLHYLSAERDLFQSNSLETQARGLLALGGVDFDNRSDSDGFGKIVLNQPVTLRGSSSDCAVFQALQFRPLPHSLQEVEEVVAFWEGAWNGREGDGLSTGAGISLTGSEASEAAFKAHSPGNEILHLATHGYFLGQTCSSPFQETRGVGGIVAKNAASELMVVGESPLLFSGLALAGANQRLQDGSEGEDGILTAEEIAALDLRGVRWAVLSACDTGMGEVQPGEGVLGLRRAFQVAGARTVIMSLWPVSDRTTSGWMNALYEARLVKGLNTVQSVREACLSVLRERRSSSQSTHPFYWAGFIAAGDWN